MKASALSSNKTKKNTDKIEKCTHDSPQTGRAVKGARRAFILTLDSPPRPRKSQRERSETKFSEASFPGGSVFFWLSSPPKLDKAAQAFKAENRNHPSISECFHCAPTKGSRVIIQVNLVRPNHLSGQDFESR
jgi:hypothetical protein